jgi:5-methylcytosine-specific restriction endonuclease McrA
MRPQSDTYPEVLDRTLRAVVSSGVSAGRAILAEIAYLPRDVAPRPPVDAKRQGAIFLRDRFYCRYCNGKTILTSVMELVGTLYPEIFPYHGHWKGGLTHPAFLTRSAIVDHVEPGAWGGGWDDPDNLVTACWPCNSVKSDFTLSQLRGWHRQPIREDDGWRGLTQYYPQLWKLANFPKPSLHRKWMRAVGVEPPPMPAAVPPPGSA